ncbi:dopamine D2-like receptor [Xiphophorus hellerii]|uniref:dopamine D2-like receptor n=1 Tax=Xiphophorus hellerii TaxID=8084 RepID=UPI0013B3FB0F|nr:dopamine D2-like receptor [Xiphophorus hellerii]
MPLPPPNYSFIGGGVRPEKHARCLLSQPAEHVDALNSEMRGAPTSIGGSGNITFWEAYIDFALVVTNSFVLLITSAVGTAANVFVILAVCHQKSLQTSVNALVVNLAVVDFLRCTVDCPVLLHVIVTLHRGGHVDRLICETQTASFSFSCCIQLSTLGCISAERYQAIANPFKTTQRKRRMMALIPLTWLLGVSVAAVCQVFLKDSPVYVRCKEGQRGTSSTYDTVGLYMLLPLWVSCFGVITGFYARIFALLRSHNRKIFDEGTSVPSKVSKEDKHTPAVENGQDKCENKQILSTSVVEPSPIGKNSLLASEGAPQSASITPERKTEFKITVEMSHLEKEQLHPLAAQDALQTVEKMLKTEQSSADKTEAKTSNQDTPADRETQEKSRSLNQESQTGESPKPESPVKENSLLIVPSTQSELPKSTFVLLTGLKQENNSTGGETQAAPTLDQEPPLPPVQSNEAVNLEVQLEGAVCVMPSKASKERASKRKETKMAKRAGYIIITFLLFWLPLITTILVNFLVHKNRKMQKPVIQDMEILSVSVSCITSLSDPIIYAAVNPQFRSEFYKLRSWVKSRFYRK